MNKENSNFLHKMFIFKFIYKRNFYHAFRIVTLNFTFKLIPKTLKSKFSERSIWKADSHVFLKIITVSSMVIICLKFPYF